MKPQAKSSIKTRSRGAENSILVLHGPNLNLLGEREPEIYGTMTLAELNRRLKLKARQQGAAVKIFQSNHEGVLIDLIHRHRKWASGILINPGAYTHYSYAIRDALSSVNLPVVEVHLSDLKKREKFRQVSVIREICLEQISGHGWQSYTLGLEKLVQHSQKKTNPKKTSGGR
jgi:3-dehydroquinate dehydratase-2